jgi:hypothetical protein
LIINDWHLERHTGELHTMPTRKPDSTRRAIDYVGMKTNLLILIMFTVVVLAAAAESGTALLGVKFWYTFRDCD